jgi:integrase/recombinase XerC
MRRTTLPDAAAPPIAPVNAAHLAAFSASLSARPVHTRAAYLRDTLALAALARDADLARLGPAELRRFLATLHGRGLAGRSLARALSSWRAFYRHLQDRDPALGENPCAGLKAPKSRSCRPALPRRACVSSNQGTTCWCATGRLELAYSSGLRLAELAGLDLDRVDLSSGEVRVWGKGAKERVVPVGDAAREAIRAWLPMRAGFPKADPNALFLGRSGARITPRAIQRRLAQWAIRQGLARHVHPHMRHSFASHVLQSSGDLRAVQEMLGHASIASTQVYTHLDFQYLAKAYDAAHPRAKKRRR